MAGKNKFKLVGIENESLAIVDLHSVEVKTKDGKCVAKIELKSNSIAIKTHNLEGRDVTNYILISENHAFMPKH